MATSRNTEKESRVPHVYYSYAEAARYTGLHRVTLYRAAFRTGHLRASGYGSAVRFRVEDLDEFMRARHGRA